MSKSNRRPQTPKNRTKKTSFEKPERRIHGCGTSRNPKHRNRAFEW